MRIKLILGVALLLLGLWSDHVDAESVAPAVPVSQQTPPVPATAGSEQCELSAASKTADTAALQQQITDLQQQLAAQKSGAVPVKDFQNQDIGIRIKNLPPGSYRDRCFACMTAPDEDGGRMLLCTCPTGPRSLDRLILTLNNCKPGEDIALCAGMLVCGPCKASNNLGRQLPPVNQNATDSQKLDDLFKQ